MEAGGPIQAVTQGPSLLSPAFVAMRGIVKVSIIIGATVLAMAGKLDSAGVTAIYTAVIVAGPAEQAAAGIPELRLKSKAVEAEAEIVKAKVANDK